MEVDRMKEYWKTIGSGFAVTIFLLLIVSTPWLTIRSDRVQQIRIQAAYLAELSGYEGEEKNPMRQSRIVQELVNITRWKNETNTDDIEDCLYTWFRLMSLSYFLGKCRYSSSVLICPENLSSRKKCWFAASEISSGNHWRLRSTPIT